MRSPQNTTFESAPIRVKITPDGRRALVSCATASEVAVFDVASREELGRVVISADIVDEAGQRLFGAAMEGSPTPIGVLVPPDGKRAYVAAANADQVLEVDLETLTVVRGMRTGREPDGLGWSPLALEPAELADRLEGETQLSRVHDLDDQRVVPAVAKPC